MTKPDATHRASYFSGRRSTSDHGQRVARADGKRCVERGDVVVAQSDRGCGDVLAHMLGCRRFWYRERAFQADEKGERDLPRACAVTLGDSLEELSLPRPRRREVTVPERAVADDCDAVLLAIRPDGALDRPFFEMVEHLVA